MKALILQVIKVISMIFLLLCQQCLSSHHLLSFHCWSQIKNGNPKIHLVVSRLSTISLTGGMDGHIFRICMLDFAPHKNCMLDFVPLKKCMLDFHFFKVKC